MNENNTLSYEEFLILVRYTTIAMKKLSDRQFGTITYMKVMNDLEYYKNNSQYLSDEGIAPQMVYKFILSSPRILECLRRFSLISPSIVKINFSADDWILHNEELEVECTKYLKYFTKDFLHRRKGLDYFNPESRHTERPTKYKESELEYPRLTHYKGDLEYVYGMDDYGRRGCIKGSDEGVVLYPAGPMMVVYDIEKKGYRYFHEHESNIECFEVVGSTCISSELSEECNVIIWSIETLEVQAKLTNCLQTGVFKMAVSEDFKHLALLGKAREADTQMIIYDLGNVLKLYEVARNDNKHRVMKSSKFEIQRKIKEAKNGKKTKKLIF